MNGNLKNCPSCGKLFLAQPKQKLCTDCFEKQREEEESIIRYVNTHPEASTLDAIVEGTGAPPKEILRIIHESRFLQADRDQLSVRELRHAHHARALLRGLHARLQGGDGTHRLKKAEVSFVQGGGVLSSRPFAETSHGGELKLKEIFSDTTHERRVEA